jgi:diguanylate cyclase (GGDEF)-like protein/hemerythrin-like metal-binding protein/PAS domain S-box-containing protein
MLAPKTHPRFLLSEGIELLLARGLLAIGVAHRGVLVEASPRFTEIFGIEGRGPGATTLGELVAETDRERVVGILGAHEAEGPSAAPFSLIFDAVRPDGTVFEAELEGASGALEGGFATVLLATDVTERRRTEKQLSDMAFLDPLTNLPNRALFLDRMREQLAAARRDGRVFAVMLCDLDGFKQVNDTLGHDAGDALLQIVARRLEGTVRGSDTVARQGGDEFAVILSRVARREDAAIVAERMVRCFDAPLETSAGSCRIGISIGIASFPADGADIDTLVARADAAMYESKRAGKNRFTFAALRPEAAPQTISLPFFRWTDAHEVGVAVVDAQHRGLLDQMNRLGADLKAGRDHDAIRATIRALMLFARRHFVTEERLMAECPGWPGEAKHRQEHQKLLVDLTSLGVGLDTKSMTLTVRFLQDWLVGHMEGTDKPMAAWLNGHGVA